MDQRNQRGILDAAQAPSLDVPDRHAEQFGEEEQIVQFLGHGDPSGRTGKPERVTGGADCDKISALYMSFQDA
jgi:hypothetical protein